MNPANASFDVAATVVLVRDGAGGPETLMLERPSDRGSFAGAWVFPGGRVDPEDGDPGAVIPAEDRQPVSDDGEERSARRAAVRELHEETGLALSATDAHLISCWTPPRSIPRRFRTWFYLATDPGGEITLAADEAVDHAWLRPVDALEAHEAGKLQLVAPTWVTLHLLAVFNSVEEILGWAAARPETYFHTRHTEDGQVILWEPDVAYADQDMLEAPGPRHRLEVARLPWVYTRSVTAGRAAE